MRKGVIICVLFILGALSLSLNAQTQNSQDSINGITAKRDSSFLQSRTGKRSAIAIPHDSIMPQEEKGKPVVLVDSVIFNKPEFKPNPKKAVIYSAIFPGLGQIYNRRYWKLPIIYGGFIGLTYAISWNGGMYSDYSQAYKDLASGNGDSWKNVISSTYWTSVESNPQAYISQMKRQKDNFRRNRDLAIICTVGLYALCMLDAYVDAQLYDFDISPDLSMRVEPVLFEPTMYSKRSVGLQCSINF